MQAAGGNLSLALQGESTTLPPILPPNLSTHHQMHQSKEFEQQRHVISYRFGDTSFFEVTYTHSYCFDEQKQTA